MTYYIYVVTNTVTKYTVYDINSAHITYAGPQGVRVYDNQFRGDGVPFVELFLSSVLPEVYTNSDRLTEVVRGGYENGRSFVYVASRYTVSDPICTLISESNLGTVEFNFNRLGRSFTVQRASDQFPLFSCTPEDGESLINLFLLGYFGCTGRSTRDCDRIYRLAENSLVPAMGSQPVRFYCRYASQVVEFSIDYLENEVSARIDHVTVKFKTTFLDHIHLMQVIGAARYNRTFGYHLDGLLNGSPMYQANEREQAETPCTPTSVSSTLQRYASLMERPLSPGYWHQDSSRAESGPWTLGASQPRASVGDYTEPVREAIRVRFHRRKYLTLMPYASYKQTASVLSDKDLKAMRVVALRVLRTLSSGQLNNLSEAKRRSVELWEDHKQSLLRYGCEIAKELRHRGFADTSLEEFQRELIPGLCEKPHWVFWPQLVNSHRAYLLLRGYRKCFVDKLHSLGYTRDGLRHFLRDQGLRAVRNLTFEEMSQFESGSLITHYRDYFGNLAPAEDFVYPCTSNA